MRLSDRIAEQLQALIATQGLQPGARLPAERQLAAELGVSRPSLREAIGKLASQGVLESRHGGGTYVRAAADDWTGAGIVAPLAALLGSLPEYGYDVLEVRHALEGATAWYAALRATEADKARIRAAYEAMLPFHGGDDPTQVSRRDAEYHLAIAEASHNAVLTQVMRGLFDLLHSNVSNSRRKMYTLPQTFEQLAAQHREVMQAILAGDAPAAREAVHRHLEFVHTTLRSLDEDEARLARFSRLPPSSQDR